MTKHIAITGGIGSGKSYVCSRLAVQGISVYDCDKAAKRLMATSADIRQGLIGLVGPEAYIGDKLNKPKLASFLLASEENKQAVNEVVHPAVAADFLASGCEWLESAILFESGFHRRLHFNAVVCVTAPEDVRVQRVMKRDGISRQRALEWVRCQMAQEEMVRLSTFQISNDGCEDIDQQINELLLKLKYL